MKTLHKRKLSFHPIADLFSTQALSADFLPKLKYKQITQEVQELFEEISLAVDITSAGPTDARARAYAVITGNDKFCEANDAPMSLVELTAELVLQTLKRLAFVRSIEGAVYKDTFFAYKPEKFYADLPASQLESHIVHLKVFSKIQDMLAKRTFSAKNINQDIVSACNTALSACIFLLKAISEAKFSASRSNQIAKLVQNTH